MGTPEKSVQLKVFIDKKKKKVMFAEAGTEFVDILLSFLTLPLGTIARLSRKHADSKDVKVGSLTSLYESVVNLNDTHFIYPWCQRVLVNPINSSASVCQKLKVNMDDEGEPITPNMASYQGAPDPLFVKSMANFIITDDLNVLPVMFDTSIVHLNSLGVDNINLLEERTLYFCLEEFLNLLKLSLMTTTPLTNLVVGGGKPCCSSSTTNCTLRSSSALISSNSSKTQTTLKLLVQKSNKKLLICAQVESSFVELLFSFLTVPLGAAIRLTKGCSSASGIRNLYNSVLCLGDGKYLKSESVKAMLLCPKVARTYRRTTDFLPINEQNTFSGRFLKDDASFVVLNDLHVTPCPSIATISMCNTLGVSVGDLEVLEVSVGEHEALLLLNASLTSTSALTDFINAIQKEPKGKTNELKP